MNKVSKIISRHPVVCFLCVFIAYGFVGAMDYADQTRQKGNYTAEQSN